MLLVDPLTPKHVITELVFYLCFLPPQRATVTTGKGSLLPPDELNILVSNVGSL